MWTCPACGEEMEDQFHGCWRCADDPPKGAEDSPEFDGRLTQSQKGMVSSLSFYLRIPGIALMLAALFSALWWFLKPGTDLAILVPSGLLFLMGLSMAQVAGSFRRAGRSTDDDVGKLIEALRALRTLLRLGLVISALVLAVMLFEVILALLDRA